MSLDELVAMRNVILEKDRSCWSWVYKVRKWSLCWFMKGKENELKEENVGREKKKEKRERRKEKKKEKEGKREEVLSCS